MKSYKYLFWFLSATFVVSCEQLGSIDDIEPENVLTYKSLFVNESSTEAVVNGMYQIWRSEGICEMRNCMFMLAGECERSSFSDQSFLDNDISTRSSAVQAYYSKLYLLINHANTIITGLPASTPKGLNEERKQQILGESYFNRAYANMMLLKSFGEFWDVNSEYGIVLYDAPVTENVAKARASVKECYNFISSDLDRAIGTARDYEGESYYATKIAAKAVKARMYLYLKDYAKAIQTCEDVITSGAEQGLMLENGYLDIFYKKLESSEHLFTVYTDYPLETIETAYGQAGVFYDAGAFIETMLCQVADSLVGNRGDWQEGEPEGLDRRFYQTFFEGEQGYGWGHNLQKYPVIDWEDNNSYYFMRLAEIYLIKAEAEARLGQYDEARKSLKPITDRAGYDADYVNRIADKDLLQYIFEHKYVELCAENYESWYDMVRYHVLDGEDFSRYPEDIRVKLNHLVLPIPYQAIAGNGALKQNPSYVFE